MALVEQFAGSSFYQEPFFFLEDRIETTRPGTQVTVRTPTGDRSAAMQDAFAFALSTPTFRTFEPSAELVERVEQLEVDICGIEGNVRCPPWREAERATLIAVGDVISRDGDIIHTYGEVRERFPRRGTTGVPLVSTSKFEVRLQRGEDGRWSVLDFPRRSISNE